MLSWLRIIQDINTVNERTVDTNRHRYRLSFAPELVSYWAPEDLHRRVAYSFCESSFLIHHGIYHDLLKFYLFDHDDSLTS